MAKRIIHSTGGGGANQKIVNVNNNMGVKGIGNMQGTTRVIYDSVLISATTTNTQVQLFQDVNTRKFPLTNLQENKLQIGESIAMQRFSIFIMQCQTGTTNCLGISPLYYFPQFQRIYGAQMSFNIAENQVVKQVPLAGMFALFNHHAKFAGYMSTQPTAADPVVGYSMPHDVFKFDNDIIIPPQIQFYATLTLPPLAVTGTFDAYLVMKISGLGSLFAPKANY